ncbi:unnamed protein product [Meloidogyne enterolobii]|uniref:Uncharacterized protein n=1 Tax=Meloidogyne enterolobii TaxID=390850 RepID=A0ACB1APZ3_MELEN
MKFVFFKIFLLLYFVAMRVQSQQVNLGSLSLTRNQNGDLLFGLGQGANIFGFGADRRLGLNIGPGRFGAINDNGLILGNQRFGIDSQLGYENGRGFDLGSFLNLFQPIGQQFAHNFQQNLIDSQRTNLALGEVNQENVSSVAVNKGDHQFPPSIGSGWNGEEEIERKGRIHHKNHFKENLKDDEDLTMPLVPLEGLKKQ